MNFHEYLGQFMQVTRKPTLEVMRFFMQRLGDPHKQFKCIHVSGTNGKGSVVESVASIMRSAGYKVGKYTSPHLLAFNERINIDGTDISDAEIEAHLAKLKPLVEEARALGFKVKFFEVTTVLAFMHFAECKVDIAVVEVGIGSPWDCTNILESPEVCVVTKIDFDHVNFLGNTIKSIAENEAAIIKPNVPVVTCNASSALAVITKRAEANRSPLVHVMAKDVQTVVSGVDNPLSVTYRGEHFQTSLKGTFQGVNTMMAVRAVEVLVERGFEVSREQIRQGLLDVKHRARFEVLCRNPLVVFDGAHNPDSVKSFMRNVADYFGRKVRNKVFAVSLMRTKDIDAVMKELAIGLKRNSRVIFTHGLDNSFFSGEELQASFNKFATKPLHANTEVREFDKALELANFVVGSFYTYKRTLEKVGELCEK